MKKLRRRLFILAIIFALLASAGVYMYLESLDTSVDVEEEETFVVLVATQDIPARLKIDETMIKEIEVTYNPETESFYNRKEDIIGKYVLTKIYAESRFHKDSIDVTLESDLSLKISGNMRAVSLGISGNSGIANLVKPGDYVDVVVYLPKLTEQQVVVRPDIAKIILQNVEVLAVDQDLTQEVESELEEVAVDTASTQYYIATLAVPVFEVEKLVLAKDVGLIDLVLRPLEGDFAYTTEGVIWQELLLDDFDRLKDMFPNYEVNSVGEVIIDPNEVKYDKYVYYTVEYGDTLREISLLFYGTEENYILLQQVNNIKDENIISAGMGIRVPVLENRGE
ncbi:Flp pilus assembly protein CpaB [Acidaminobacter sp. JC074]|uniref:Flp pilus assembly protein CpaB n=1 Tax=Acidaminobacter sp. JC074 TaxID=2530199 RepID=UPI001F0D49CC|nr:Flp pilus assembly protein CpaB [Acidaminobacter sp. JC074]MCH4890438.1 Flp pilus assembly protein CpaB [Acidaminobacter sp. JC074]